MTIEQHAIKEVRKQLGTHNDDRQPVEWCVQNMHRKLTKATDKNEEDRRTIEAMKKVIRKHKLSI